MDISISSYFERVNKVLRMESMKSLKKISQRARETHNIDQKVIKEIQRLLLEYIDENN